MVITLKTPNLPLQNFFHYDDDLLVVSFDSTLRSSYPLRVRELGVDALCALPLLEPYIGLLGRCDGWRMISIKCHKWGHFCCSMEGSVIPPFCQS